MKNRTRSVVDEILELFCKKGHSLYGGECVTQREHALQAAMLAESENAPAELITAALLHDIGHLLHDLPEDAPDEGVDDGHEQAAYQYLIGRFVPAVTEPVRLHVSAKRYLCAVEPEYLKGLSPPSLVSLKLQGGPMTAQERGDFLQNPFSQDAVRLRYWDDAAKIAGHRTPALEHFIPYQQQSVVKEAGG